jgi:molybdate transport system substrate-binding protein
MFPDVTRRSLLWALVVSLLLLVVPAGAAEPAAPPLAVYAAASLAESLPKVGAAWTARTGQGVTFAFGASSRLAKQIGAGAPADVFVSADTEWVDFVAARVPVTARAALLRNTLVAAVRTDAPALAGPAALAEPGWRRLALAGENVPAGRYARAALAATGVWGAVEGRVVSGDSVRTALAWVAAGEADAAIVYRTDVRVEPRVREAFAFPASAHPPIVYGGAALAGRSPSAAAFLAFCQSAEARALFAAAGFTPPP